MQCFGNQITKRMNDEGEAVALVIPYLGYPMHLRDIAEMVRLSIWPVVAVILA